MERSIIQTGNYKLVPEYSKFEIPGDLWAGRDLQVKRRHIARFMRTTKSHSEKASTSSDRKTTVLRATNGGKKPGQVKRKRAARTTTIAQ